jgi:hypothetical protein
LQAAAAGVLILAMGPAGLAQSLPADEREPLGGGQDAKMGAVLDLCAAGRVQANQRAAEAVQARVSAEVQTEVQTPAQAPTDMTTRSLIDLLKVAGRLQANQRAAQAVKEASTQVRPGSGARPSPGQPPRRRRSGPMSTLKAAGRLQASQRAAQAVKESSGAGAQGPAQAPGQGQQDTGTSQTTQEALEAARVASEQALERAREQAGMDESALKGAPRGFREALERMGGFHSLTTADNASRGAASRGTTTH